MSEIPNNVDNRGDLQIAVVGISCIFPGADSAREFWDNLVDGHDAVGPAPPHRDDQLDCFDPGRSQASLPRGGFFQHDIPFDPQRYGILPNAVKRGDPDQFFMLRVVDEALADARIDPESGLRKTTDLIVGNGGYTGQKLSEMLLRAAHIDSMLGQLEQGYPASMARQRSEMDAWLRSRLPPNDVEAVSTCIPNIVASRAANRLNLGGAAYVVDAACASSLIAVEDAAVRLRSRRCDVAVAAGVFLKSCTTFRHVFNRLGALSPEGIIRPMDEAADGLVVGEGGGAVVLRRLEDAVRDGDEVYAILRGIGSSSDGRDVDVLAPSKVGQLKALRRAYDDAGVDPAKIGYLELHGTGTAVGDRVEAETICDFYGVSDQPATARCAGSVKSMIGHTMPAAGIASFIKTVLALSNRVIPPSLHCESPRSELASSQFYLNVETRPWVQAPEDGPRRAGVNTFGFGGINVHAVLEEVDASDSGELQCRQFMAPATRPTELFCFSADSRELLIDDVERLRTTIDGLPESIRLADVGHTQVAGFDTSASWRLAVVASCAAELESRLSECLRDLREGKCPESQDIFCGDETTRAEGKTAVVFPGIAWPGLAGAYPDHLRELCVHYPEVRREFDIFEGRDRHPLDTTPTSAIFWPPALLPEEYKEKLKDRLAPPRSDMAARQKSDEDPEERYLAAMGVTMSNWVSWLLLRKLGVDIDMIVGQSQGEMAGLCAAGSCSFQEMAPDFFRVLDLDWDVEQTDHCAFVWCPIDKMEQRIAKYEKLSIAIYITPEAELIGGPHDELKRFGNELREEGHMFQIVPYSPIHTPAFSHLRAEMTRVFSASDGTFQAPEIPIYSAITKELYPNESDAIRQNLIRNLDEPVHMWQTLCRMYDDGARIFIQVGGGQVASSLDQLLPDRPGGMGVAMENEAINPVTQINRMCGQLIAAGISLDASQLYARRGLRTLDFNNLQATDVSPSAIPIRLDWHLFDSSAPQHPGASLIVETEEREPAVADQTLESEPSDAASAPPGDWPSTDHLPMAGQLISWRDGRHCVTRRVLDLDQDLFLLDHVFANCEGLKPPAHCVPVLPMTFGIETMVEVASLLVPDSCLVGISSIRASQWIGLDDRSTQTIECHAERSHDDRTDGRLAIDVRVLVGDSVHLSGTALFDRVRQPSGSVPPPPDVYDNNEIDEWPWPADRIYSEKVLFHGPALQLVRQLEHNGNRVFSGGLLVADRDALFAGRPEPVLQIDPAFMDAVGQLIGLWAMSGGDYILPTGVEHIEICQETPVPGTLARVVCEATEYDRELKRARFNVWVDNGHGETWMHMSGWSDYLFGWKSETSSWYRSPRHFVLGSEIERADDDRSVLLAVTTRDLPRSITDRAARSALTLSEVQHTDQLGDAKQQQRFVMSRVAAKDAARLWYTRFRPDIDIPHPVELQIETDDAGRPWLSQNGVTIEPWISIAHKGTMAIAVACGEPVGLDLEPACSVDPALADQIASESEQQLFAGVGHEGLDANWLTRLWCAKEAVAKQLGTGLQGHPDQFVAVDVNPDNGQFLMHILSTGETEVVSTCEVSNMIIAVTTGRGVHAAAASATYDV